jgi:SPP1 gp7 family putative phage head morphogenesis protein
MDEALRARQERALQADLQGVFADLGPRLAADPAGGARQLARRAADAIYASTRETAELAAVALWLLLFDEDLPGGLALATDRWAAENAKRVGISMADNVVQDLGAKAESQPLTPAAVAETLTDSRAEAVAITETTKADSAGQMIVKREVESSPHAERRQQLNPVWITEQDERVCPICQPLHGKRYDSFKSQFPMGPPAHPQCRCTLDYQA